MTIEKAASMGDTVEHSAARAAHIDGLRAIAVVLVLIFHAYPQILPGGFIGVDVFFVISGYLITGIILDDCRRHRFSFLRFYARRIRRLFPALALVLLSSIAAGWFLLLPAEYMTLAKEAVAGALFVPNFLFWSQAGYFDAAANTKPLLHLWSLGIEEQFYLLWPPLMYLSSRRRIVLPAALIGVTSASFIYCAYLTRSDPSSAFYLPFTRVWELSLGGMLAAAASVVTNRTYGAIAALFGLVAILVSAVLLSPQSGFPGIVAIIPTLGAIALIWSKSSVLSPRPLAYVGLISYPLYLWHWPILFFAKRAGFNSPISALALSFALAIVTYEMIEKRSFRHMRLTRAAASAGFGMAIAASLGAAVFVSGGVYSRYPEDVAAVLHTMNYDYGKDARLYTCWLVDERGPQEFSPSCFARGREKSVMLWGDSHAARLYPGLRANSPNLQISQITRSSCPPIPTPYLRPHCKAGNDVAINSIKTDRPGIVILMAAWENYADDWSRGSVYGSALINRIKELKAMDVPEVIVVGPAPVWKPELPSLVYANWRVTGEIPARLLVDQSNGDRIEKQMEAITTPFGARYFSMRKALCDASGCAVHAPDNAGELTSWDYGHLTTWGAMMVSKALAQQDSQLNP
jgi:peptidoglycan/LPS O-acetylase OafA/YrhL